MSVLSASQAARRERILASAQELLREREYDRIQVREVAEHAGVALGTLYRYFPSKDLLYAHALVAWSEGFEARVQGRDRGATDADRLRAMLRAAVRAYERSPSFYRLLTVLEATAEPAARAVFSDFGVRFLTMMRQVLRDTDPDDAAAIASVAGAVLGAELRGWAQRGTPIRVVEQRLDTAVDLLFRRPRAR